MNNKTLRLVLIVILVSGYYIYEQYTTHVDITGVSAPATSDELFQAIQDRSSDVQVRGSGEVVKILPDDTRGSQHQRFLVELSNGHTILIAHNIDLAPRVDTLREGDEIGFYGEFEWNDKGGVVHWTHHDPGNRHPHGWLEHRGKRYQ